MTPSRQRRLSKLAPLKRFRKQSEDHHMPTIEQIAKASNQVLEALAEAIQKRDPTLTWLQAKEQASLSPEYSAAHRSERAMRLGKSDPAYVEKARRAAAADDDGDGDEDDAGKMFDKLITEHKARGLPHARAVEAAALDPRYSAFHRRERAKRIGG
jgi:hypothetical protein